VVVVDATVVVGGATVVVVAAVVVVAVVVVRATVVVDATVVGATVVVAGAIVVVRATVVVVVAAVVVVVGRGRWRSIEIAVAETWDSINRNAVAGAGDGLLLLAANANVLSREAPATRLMTQTTVTPATFFFLDMTLPREPMPVAGMVRKTYRRDFWRAEVSPAQVHVWRPAPVLSPGLIRSEPRKRGVYEPQIKRSPTLLTPDQGRRLRSGGRGQADCAPAGTATIAGSERPAFPPSGNAVCPNAGDPRSRP
jgi:hypothetical protein